MAVTFNVANNSVQSFKKLKSVDTSIPYNEFDYLVNAVEIDWNSANLPEANTTNGGALTINDTKDLLELINSIQKEIYVLTAAVVALAQK